ncbi:L-seryl-tRNA(Sec) selenium transferase [Desulfovibrionales bacterium]
MTKKLSPPPSQLFRALPSVDLLLGKLARRPETSTLPRLLLRELTSEFLDWYREKIHSGQFNDQAELAPDRLLSRLACFAYKRGRPHFRRMLNATGVVVHTNLGRSLLCPSAITAVIEANTHYSNLELNLVTGSRGSRYSHVEKILCRVTGAEAALVVNNNAAAVLLILDTLAKGREVVISRGELVEIGDSFRISEVVSHSRAVLREVGATNRTHLWDYAEAIGPDTAALMKVHYSNFRIVGFTNEVELEDLVALGHKTGLPVIYDLGSGTLFDFSAAGLPGEPTVAQLVAKKPDLLSFSGDKALGGPQAGIVVGRKEWVDKLKRNPLNRALRTDKMTIAALEATLRCYLDLDTVATTIPTLAMITASPEALKTKARTLLRQIKRTLGNTFRPILLPGVSRVGGGAFPERDLPTTLVALAPGSARLSADGLRARLLTTDPPLIGRIENDLFCLDPRTIAPDEDRLVASALTQAIIQIADTDISRSSHA